MSEIAMTNTRAAEVTATEAAHVCTAEGTSDSSKMKAAEVCWTAAEVPATKVSTAKVCCAATKVSAAAEMATAVASG
jgi:hypothetical protein